MPEYIVVKAAYGKELSSKKEVTQHYVDRKDFMILSLVHGPGSYINRTDCEKKGNSVVLEVRYGKKSEKLTMINPVTFIEKEK